MSTNEEKHAEAYLAAAEAVRALNPEDLAARAGGGWEAPMPDPEQPAPAGKITLPVLASRLTLGWPELDFELDSGGGSGGDSGGRSGSHSTYLISFPFRLMTLHYLHRVTAGEPGEDWVSYREIPDGLFYADTVAREVERPLAARFAGDPQAFLEAGARLGGEPLTLGDAAFVLRPFPKMPMAFALYLEDEDFPAEARVLYERCVAANLPLQDLRILAEHLGGLLRTGPAGASP